MYRKNGNHLFKHLDFLILDILAVQLAFILSYISRQGLGLVYKDSNYLRLACIAVLICVCVAVFSECYSGILKRGYLKEFKSSFIFVVLVVLLCTIYLYFMKKSGSVSRGFMIYVWIEGTLLIFLLRSLNKKIVLKYSRQTDKRRILLLTVRDYAEAMTANFTKQELLQAEGIVILDQNMTGQSIHGIPVVSDREHLEEYLKDYVIDEVMVNVARSGEYDKEIQNIMRMGITVHYCLIHIADWLQDTMLENVAGYDVLTTSVHIASTRQLILKRLMDIVGSTVGLLITAVVFVIIAPIIKIQSPGPIFFSQIRVGRNGRKFRIYKFRSMYTDAEERKAELMAQNKVDGLMFKMDNDPRIFPFGHFIRKFSLDELPQFWNVLKGDMSLVGTRPPTVDEYINYDIHHMIRLAYKPGITGLWQVSGRSEITDFEQVVALDEKYITHWSLGLDIKILFKTVKVVLKHEGAE